MKIKDRSKEEIQQIIKDSWLNIYVNESTIYNPMMSMPVEFEDRPELYITYLMTRPEYFSFVCKEFLGIQLLPIQALMLQELWVRKFPMLIATRGGGKSWLMAVYAVLRALLLPGRKIVIAGSVFRQSKVIFEYIETIWNNSPILRSMCTADSRPRYMQDMWRFEINSSKITALPIGCLSLDTMITTDSGIRTMGEYSEDKYPNKIWSENTFEDVGFFFDNGVYDCKKIITKQGFNYTGTNNHKMRVVRDNKIIWCRTDQMKIGDYILIDKSERWFNSSFNCTKEEAYALGCMIGDGSYVNKYYLHFTTIDEEFIDRLRCIGDFQQQSDKIHYCLFGKDKVSNWLNFWQMKPKYTKDKKLPNTILSADKKCVAECLAGLFDTDGHIFHDTTNGSTISVNYTTISKTLAYQIQYILLHFGIVSTITSRFRKNKNAQKAYELSITGLDVVEFYKKIPLKLNRKAQQLKNAIDNKKRFLSNEKHIIPISKNLLLEILDIKYLGDNFSRWKINKKTKFTRKYCEKFLKACYKKDIKHKNIKIIEELLNRDVIYSEIVNIEEIKQCYTVDLNVPKNNTYCANGFISHNTGDKIRGQRAHDILADEFAAQSEEVFENVISGFAVVSSNVVQGVQRYSAAKMSEILGELTDEYEEDEMDSNQIVLSGTAYYDFNHFARYWKDWKEIINSRGDKKKLESYFERKSADGTNKEIPEGFNWKDYSVIRIPIDLFPKGFMDESNIARSKATIHSSNYNMEFGACVQPDTLVYTDCGLKKIQEIKINDKVLTHLGNFKRVNKIMYRYIDEDINVLKSYGFNKNIGITKEHPFWNGNDFSNLDDIDNLRLPIVNTSVLNNNKFIDLENYTKNYIIRKDYIYPQSGARKITYDEELEILKSRENKSILSKRYNVSYNTISNVFKKKKRPKTALNKNIALDYDFGIILGYYAAEGSCGSCGKAVSFSLDSHVNNKLEAYIEELSISLERSIGFAPKFYKKEDNVCDVNINSRIFVDLISKICPGDCYTKFIDSDILYSNLDLIKGFIVGFWNGDGYINKNFATSGICSLKLLSQIKLCLSLFGITSSINIYSGGKCIINEKEFDNSDKYVLNIHGTDFSKFMKIFYNKTISKKNRKTYIWTDNHSNYKIKSVKQEKYQGIVYNLEVEDDNSYCLPASAVHNCFSKDSSGFFKRSLIESCVAKPQNNICFPSVSNLVYYATTSGNKEKKYVYGIDPASEIDNFSIVVLEIWPDHRRIVYVWTSNKKEFKELLKKGLIQENDYYTYCARKIRDLMIKFPTERIGIDSQGGGYAISEALHDKDRLRPGEIPLWPVIDYDKPADTDAESGLHYLKLVQFADYTWLSEANHGMRLDFENRTLIFPHFDAIETNLSIEKDRLQNKIYDTLEDCVLEIEELKDELAQIVMTSTPSGTRDKWDTPETKLPGGKKGRLKKDRYSALLIANACAKELIPQSDIILPTQYGGFAGNIEAGSDRGKMFNGPEWYIKKIEGVY